MRVARRAKADAVTRRLAAHRADYAHRAAPCADPVGSNPPCALRTRLGYSGTASTATTGHTLAGPRRNAFAGQFLKRELKRRWS